MSPLSAALGLVAVQLLALGALPAAEVVADVPDEYGLGERLALVAWLSDHHVAVADPRDVPALRRLYATKAHPDPGPPVGSTLDEQQHADLAAELYREFGRNPPAGASVADITTLIASLTAHADEVVANDQAIAQANALAHPRTAPPPASPAAQAPLRPAKPAAPAMPPAAAPGSQDDAQLTTRLTVGKAIPEISGFCIDSSPFSSADWKGKVVLVDAWATSCGPCLKEMPNVIAAYRAFHPLGLEMLGVSRDSDRAKLFAEMGRLHITWPMLMEPYIPDGPTGAVTAKLGITYIPANFLIDANGVVIARDLRGPALPAALEKIFGKPPPP